MMTSFENMVVAVIICYFKMKSLELVLIQYDLYPYKKIEIWT